MNILHNMDCRDLYSYLGEKDCLKNDLFEFVSYSTSIPNTDAFKSIGWMMLDYLSWLDFIVDEDDFYE